MFRGRTLLLFRPRIAGAVATVAVLGVGGGLLGVQAGPLGHALPHVSSPATLPGSANQTAIATQPVVVAELFTSEGCSSCPPAEERLAALNHLVADSFVTFIPLAFHVEYWDQLGWRDPYGDTSYTRRQQAYDGTQIYTPQSVVNGVTAELAPSLLHSATPLAREVTIAPSASTTSHDITIRIGGAITAVSSGRPAPSQYVYLAITEDSLVSHVTAGENAGRDLHHVGVVRAFREIATIGDTAATITGVAIPAVPNLRAAHAHVVILVQVGHGRLHEIIGAATRPFDTVHP